MQKKENKTIYKKTHKQQKQKDAQNIFTYISLSTITSIQSKTPQIDRKTTNT